MNQIAEVIGRRLRARRRLMGLTQTAVGEACGLTFQQVHKYETGLMMIPASRLWRLSGALGVPVSYFFEGLSAGPSVADLSRDAAQPVSPPAAPAAE
jgi:transcriptional regulator with XRE-family HTH domain